jgi:hypothetical protein
LHFSRIASIRLLANATISLFEEISRRDSPMRTNVKHSENFVRTAQRVGRADFENHFLNDHFLIAEKRSNPIIARVSRGHHFKTPCG